MLRHLLFTCVAVIVVLAAACASSSESDSGSSSFKLELGDSDFEAFPSEFDEFAIYWVGEEFGGHSLRKIIRQISLDSGLRDQNSVTFLYGTCVIEPEPDGRIDGGCPPPLQIIVQPYCVVPPELVGNGTRPSGIEKIRGGADAVGSGGDIRLWTGDVTVKVYAPLELEDEVIDALTSPNGLGVGAGEDMPPPAAECPPYETPDLDKLNEQAE